MKFEIGIFSFGDHGRNPVDGSLLSPAARMRNLIEEAVLAEEVGLDIFGLGEHHRADFIISAPEVALAAIAARTERIRLTSAVTVLSSDDPIRVFQRFATLDLLSGGRAEIIAGRGSFIESFPVFGFDLSEYEALFDEKLELLLRVREQVAVHWSGRRCAAKRCTRGRCRAPCRCGSGSGGRRRRWCAPGRSVCRWRSPSSAVTPIASNRLR